MDRYRLKNIIILILSLMNVFLLASLAIREGARQSAKETAVDQLVSLPLTASRWIRMSFPMKHRRQAAP